MLQAILLAAGRSTRFQTSLSKLSHTICGQEMIAYPIKLLASLNIPTTIVVGYQKEVILSIAHKYQPAITAVEQTIQKGTGHAVLCTQSHWSAENILILNGDVPLLEKQQLEALIKHHTTTNATISLVGAFNADPTVTGYGRIVRNESTIAIVEQRDFKGNPEKECLLNAGIYIIKKSFLERELPYLPPHSTHGELYITDLIKKASESQEKIEVVEIPFDSVRGINTLKELWVAEHLKKSELIVQWMSKGVRFVAPQSNHIDLTVSIGPDSCIGYGVQLRNETKIGNNVHVDAFSVIDNSIIHDDAIVHPHSIVSQSELFSGCQVGPFAHVHRKSTLHAQSIIGNFVEVSKSSIGKKSKAKHLTYLGQALVGEQVNIGAGSITCNFDSVAKHTTTIENQAFIGSNTSLIAPVTIGKESVVAAGSVITQDVPAQAVAIARERQINKELYAPQLKEKLQQKHIGTLMGTILIDKKHIPDDLNNPLHHSKNDYQHIDETISITSLTIQNSPYNNGNTAQRSESSKISAELCNSNVINKKGNLHTHPKQTVAEDDFSNDKDSKNHLYSSNINHQQSPLDLL